MPRCKYLAIRCADQNQAQSGRHFHIQQDQPSEQLCQQSSMAAESPPPLCGLIAGTPAVVCIFRHLSKYNKQQFSLSCKHAHILALAAVAKLNLGHKWYNSRASNLLSSRHAAFPSCTCVSIRPRTVDELSKLASELLLHKVQRMPALAELRLELQGVYDKHYDLSLIVKSIPLHTAQVTSLYVHQTAMLTSKAVAAMAEMPLLSSLTLKNAHGFEPGALAKLASVSNLAALHLEIIDSSSGSMPTSPVTSGGSITPSELARLQASDEVGLAKCTRLVSLAAINLTKPGAFRPVDALLQAIAGSLKPWLTSLVLGNMPDLSTTVLEMIAGIPSISQLSLAGCDIAGSADVAKLSALPGLSDLGLAPSQPPAAALAALAKGCKRLGRVSMGAVQLNPGFATMAGVSHLQMLACSPVAAVATAAAGSGSMTGSSSIANSFNGMSLRVQPPVQLNALARVWPSLSVLEISGWAVDAAGVAAIRQLECLTAIKLVGGSEAGTTLHAKVLLPLLDMPLLQQLVMLELADLTDEWVADAVRNVGGAAGGGSFRAVKELHLGSAAAFVAPTGSSNAAGSTTPSSPASGGSSAAAGSGTATATAGPNGSQMVTDRGLVRLFACPKLQKLVLVQLPGITLAGVKALVRGSSMLSAVEVVKCPAISAAPSDVIARAAVAAPGRAVDLTVSE